jgi:hypothetical protein
MGKSYSYYDEGDRIAVGVFKGFIQKEDFVRIAEELQDLRFRNNSCRQLNICEEMMVLSCDILKWLNDVWFPKALTTGLKCFAFVIPRDLYGRLSMDRANRSFDKLPGLEIRYFDSENEARQWLNGCC